MGNSLYPINRPNNGIPFEKIEAKPILHHLDEDNSRFEQQQRLNLNIKDRKNTYQNTNNFNYAVIFDQNVL